MSNNFVLRMYTMTSGWYWATILECQSTLACFGSLVNLGTYLGMQIYGMYLSALEEEGREWKAKSNPQRPEY